MKAGRWRAGAALFRSCAIESVAFGPTVSLALCDCAAGQVTIHYLDSFGCDDDLFECVGCGLVIRRADLAG